MRVIKILNIFAKTPLVRETVKQRRANDVMSRSVDLDSSCVVLYTQHCHEAAIERVLLVSNHSSAKKYSNKQQKTAENFFSASPQLVVSSRRWKWKCWFLITTRPAGLRIRAQVIGVEKWIILKCCVKQIIYSKKLTRHIADAAWRVKRIGGCDRVLLCR